MLRAEPITDVVAFHGECPFWDARSNRLIWSDVYAGDLLALDQSGRVTRIVTPADIVTVVRRRRDGGFILAGGRDLWTADDQLDEFSHLLDLPLAADARTNDGGCDPLGGFVIGSVRGGQHGKGVVLRIDPSGQLRTLVEGVTISNGVQWSADGSTVYYIDTPTRRVDCFRVDRATGDWSQRQVFADLGAETGAPDGMAIDTNGCLWIAMWGGGQVVGLDLDGKIVDRIETPGATQPSACTFGGRDLRTLYITSSAEDLGRSVGPHAGALYSIRLLVPGAELQIYGSINSSEASDLRPQLHPKM